MKFDYSKLQKTFATGRKKLLHFIMNKNKTVEEKVYEAMGVKLFKKLHLATVGKLANFGLVKEGTKKVYLNRHIKAVYVMGLGHFAIGILYPIAHASIPSPLTSIYANMLLNGYPVMLQRYNYIRYKRAYNHALQEEQMTKTFESGCENKREILKEIHKPKSKKIDFDKVKNAIIHSPKISKCRH